jgi:hypothetical protein
MDKRLYIRADLLSKSKEQTGEHAGGTYVARVVTGTEKDGSPQYRYFRKQSEYNDYLAKQRDAKKKGKNLGQGKKTKTGAKGDKGPSHDEKLRSKLKEQQSSSSTKTNRSPSNKLSEQHSKKQSLFSGGSKKKAQKSLTLYLGDIDVK